ncbi:uncharacterized protein [Musca autumnalis]|uniref:uncharacterized protein n=1 Tax=Musca autumnalis TaxID=221902 RepID=UPI003CEF0486
MKIVLNLCIALLAIQIVFAAPQKSSTTVIETTTDVSAKTSTYHRRYQLFDTILLKVNKIVSDEILAKTSIYPNVLKNYNVWLEENKQKIPPKNLQSYEDLEKHLQDDVNTSEAFRKHPTNCTLQRKVHNLFFIIEHIRYDLRHKEVNQIWGLQQKTLNETDEEATKKEFLTNDLPLIVKDVENFIASLDEAGKKENQDIIKWFNILQSKTSDEEKIDAFDDIQDLYGEEMERETNAGEVNCRLTVQMEWREHIIAGVLMAIVSALKPDLEFSTA